MLFRNGKPAKAREMSAELSPAVLNYIIEGISGRIAEDLASKNFQSAPHSVAPGQSASDDDSSETMQRLAEAMSSAGAVEGKNFENLGEVKKVRSDQKKDKGTLETLKNIEME